ncbi:putative ribonuclease H-like domain-containing protein [Tanacetum coccineum]
MLIGGEKHSIDLLFDLNMSALEDVSIFNFSRDDEDDSAEADMNNLNTTIQVSPIPTTRIHKDHPSNKFIRDLQSATQTRKMSKNLEEHGKNSKRIETIRLFLAYASFKDFVVYQMDLKSAFLYGKIKEELYVCQPPGFEDPDFPDRVYKVEKALYGLHQAPRAWYETLSTYLLDNGFQRGKIDKTLFIKRYKGDILLVQVYVDDIVFGSTKMELCIAFEKLMHEKFQMNSIEELTFFLGLQKSRLQAHQWKLYLKHQPKLGLWYPKDSPFHLEAFSDSDYAGDNHDRRSTSGGCQYLGRRLVSWQCKKQTIVAISSTEAEYVAAASCCAQVLWMQNQLLDYGFNFHEH